MILSSATLEEEKFRRFFGNPPVVEIEGRMHEVVTRYSERGCPSDGREKIVYETIKKIHENEPDGDILVFMAGQEEIDELADTLEEKRHTFLGRRRTELPELMVLRAYSALPMHLLSEIFVPTPPGFRKLVIATNIAESSITVDGIKYVIDCGVVKEKRFVSMKFFSFKLFGLRRKYLN